MLIRDSILRLLADGDMTAAAIADELGALRNSVDKALIRCREEREIHICGHEPTTPRPTAVYRIGYAPDVDVALAAPVAPAHERQDAVNTRDANVRGVELPAYFEIDGELLPGIRHFACDRLRATLSVSSCGARWEKANGTDVDADRFHTCRRCPIGASHAGRVDHNPSPFRGMMICGRCHRGAPRLIGKHLCVSCFNRARELRLGRNAKGTAPRKLARLDQRSITYRAAGVVKTRVLDESVDVTELVVAVLRDEKHAPLFGSRAPASMDWLRDDDVYDRSIGDAVEVADVAAQMPAALDVVLADPIEDVEADPYGALRDAVEQLERDAPVDAPTTSRRAAKRLRQQARRQVRLSTVTVQLMRGVGALHASPPVIVPVPAAQPSYSASVMSGGTAFG
jgi:hypothetical protein